MNKVAAVIVQKRPLITAWIWIGLVPPGLLYWADALPFVVIMSIYANIESSFATNAAKKEGRDMCVRLDRIEEQLDQILTKLSVMD